MMVAVIFLIGPVLYMFLNFVIGPIVDKFVSEFQITFCCPGHNPIAYFRAIIDTSLSLV